MRTKRDNLRLIQLSKEQIEQGVSKYKYLITQEGTNYTAFKDRENLMRWLREREIHVEHALKEEGEHDTQKIIGEFYEEMHWTFSAFNPDDLYGGIQHTIIRTTYVLSNGDITTAWLTREKEGGKIVVNIMNPNVNSRPVHDRGAYERFIK